MQDILAPHEGKLIIVTNKDESISVCGHLHIYRGGNKPLYIVQQHKDSNIIASATFLSDRIFEVSVDSSEIKVTLK